MRKAPVEREWPTEWREKLAAIKACIQEKDILWRSLFDAIHSVDDPIMLVAGAGVSAATCLPRSSISSNIQKCCTWAGLLNHGLRTCCQRGMLTVQECADFERMLSANGNPEDYIIVASEVERLLRGGSGLKGRPGIFAEWLKGTIGALKITDDELISALHEWEGQWATTNYDHLIENVLNHEAVVWTRKDEFRRAVGRQIAEYVLHLHGSWNEPNSVVLGKDSYNAIVVDNEYQAIVQAIFTTKTVVFVGCGDGLLDPNFSKLISWVSDTFHERQKDHYVILQGDAVPSWCSSLEGPWSVLNYQDHSHLPTLVHLLSGYNSFDQLLSDLPDPEKIWMSTGLPFSASPLFAEIMSDVVEILGNSLLDTFANSLRNAVEMEVSKSFVEKLGLARKLCSLPIDAALRCLDRSIKEVVRHLSQTPTTETLAVASAGRALMQAFITLASSRMGPGHSVSSLGNEDVVEVDDTNCTGIEIQLSTFFRMRPTFIAGGTAYPPGEGLIVGVEEILAQGDDFIDRGGMSAAAAVFAIERLIWERLYPEDRVFEGQRGQLNALRAMTAIASHDKSLYIIYRPDQHSRNVFNLLKSEEHLPELLVAIVGGQQICPIFSVVSEADYAGYINSIENNCSQLA